MRHFSEEEWIEYQYGESGDREQMRQHLAQCAECAAQVAALAGDLAEMQLDELNLSEGEPHRGKEYGEKVWRGLQSLLAPYPRQKRRRLWPAQWNSGLRIGLGFASAAMVLAAIATAAFYSGRLWEQKRAPQIAEANHGPAGQRIILFVVDDHLDRSQKLLAELNDPDEAAADHRLQATARELLTENRLYRQSSAHTSSAGAQDNTSVEGASLDTILDDLEPVLVELANQPGDLDRAEIMRLRKELNTGGLLFEIRVLGSRVREGEPNGGNARQNGTV
jgi:hypothetical protein